MELRFSKMHGLGNDFVVIDAINQAVNLDTAQIRQLADRHLGIGCDQLLLVEPASLPDVDFRYRIFNADGGEVEQCGNGARCFARFVREQGLTGKDRIRVETLAGVMELIIEADQQVTVNMGIPEFEPARIPFQASQAADSYQLQINDSPVELSVLSMGNPHAVIQVDDIDTAPVNSLGPVLENHPAFPHRVNVGFMEIQNPAAIRLRVYERGAGETLACGSGACAAVVAGRQKGLLDDKVRVNLPGGDLLIHWAGDGSPVMMTGPAELVFEGRIKL
jgi:diaminopimelate epimerase